MDGKSCIGVVLVTTILLALGFLAGRMTTQSYINTAGIELPANLSSR
jgi:hypothetical protein